jgi:hypothetical protein
VAVTVPGLLMTSIRSNAAGEGSSGLARRPTPQQGPECRKTSGAVGQASTALSTAQTAPHRPASGFMRPGGPFPGFQHAV